MVLRKIEFGIRMFRYHQSPLMSSLISGWSLQDMAYQKPDTLSQLETQYFCAVELGETAVMWLRKIVTNRFLLRQLRNILAVVGLALINILFKSIDSEASLRMVAPERDFVVAPYIGQNIGEEQKENVFAAKRVGFQSESM